MTPEQKDNNRRKRHVRRIFTRFPLLAIMLIRERYPEYTEDMLPADLIRSKRPRKSFKRPKKRKHRYFRNEQIQKYYQKLKYTEIWEPEYEKIITQIVSLTDAEREGRDIQCRVKKADAVMIFYFKHHTFETYVLKFIKAANDPNNTLDTLKDIHSDLVKASMGIGMK